MRAHEALAYLYANKNDPLKVVLCASPGCNSRFVCGMGVVFPGYAQGDTEPHMYLFCSEACYLRTIPPAACAGSA